VSERLAYTVDELEQVSGVSRRVIYAHIRANRLTPRYPSTRPVFLRSEVERWLESLPTDRSDIKRGAA